ncbi:ABC transporter permease [Aureibaculum sp. A20]|uniref:ABC transporter permease n=1 Tax=Aureibaculum flavum TaxID=2795986 RepID=A0ABS0WU81_9FLAO|nr:ABC transporter permease [Aureibaculum flavum]MBJ2175546.1 ABC transporter permease [Aureibaculum flavum]
MSTILYYTASLKNELIKLKRTFAFWLTIISAVLFPILFIVAYIFERETLVPLAGINPWEKFMVTQIENSTPFFIPMFIVLITSLIMQIEHKSLGIKHLFALPVPKSSIYFGKLSIVILAIIVTYVYYYIAIILSGVLLGFVYPDLGFLNFPPEHLRYLKMLMTSFLASFGIIGIQFWLSFRFKNFVIPLGFGMFLAIIGIIVSQAPQLSIYFPYSFSVLSVSLGDKMPLIFGISSVTIFSIVCFLIISIFGYFNIKKLNIK